MNLRISFLMLAVALAVIPSGAPAQSAEPKPVVAVFDIAIDGFKLSEVTMKRLTKYLGVRLMMGGLYQTAPESQLKDAMVALKLESQKDCYDERCRVQLGLEAAANKNLNVTIWKVGGKCSIIGALYDLRAAASEEAAEVADLNCDEEGLKAGIARFAAQLSGRKGPTPSGPTEMPGALPPPPEVQGGGGGFGGGDAPPPVKAEAGYLSVEGTPKGARVDISGPKEFGSNGKSATSLPLRPIPVPAGEYRVSVSMTGYDTEEKSVRVYADATEIVKFDLMLSSGQIQISGKPDGAKSRLECQKGFVRDFGLPAPASPWTVSVPRGQCRLVVERDGYEKYEQTFEVAGGATVRQSVELKRGFAGMAGWVRIPAGTFVMGSPSSESGRYDDEGPQTRVTISRSFLLKATEVTQGEWKAVMGTSPSSFKNCGDNCPVENVSWFDAVEFCNRLSSREGLEQCYRINGTTVVSKGPSCGGYRLPTEAEWEYAARAGTTTALYTGGLTIRGDNNGPELDPIAWYGGNSGVSYSGGYDCSGWSAKQYSSSSCGTHPVGGKRPNQWGLYDMLGNVLEWCDDWKDNYSGGSVTDPTGPSSGARRVIRGGSWRSNAGYVRAAIRSFIDPGFRNVYLGLRPARSVR